MNADPAGSAGRVFACREDNSLYYRPERVNLPVRESSIVQVGRGEHNVDVQMATLGDIGLTRLGIGVEAVGVNVLNPDYVGFVVPLSWAGDFFVNGDAVKKSAIYMAGDLDSIHLRSKSRVTMGVTFPREPFLQAIAALRGVCVDDISLKERELRLSDASVHWLRTRLTAIIDRACRTHREPVQEQMSDDVLGLMADAYLQAVPETSVSPGRTGRPERIVRLAEERFEASEGGPVCLADLCAAAGVGKSCLYKAFHSVCGQPPLAYFHMRRLMRARTLLIDADCERGSVKHAALGSGFTELGRFSVQYRQLFGELPSATLNPAGS